MGSSAKGKAGATLPGLFWVPEGQVEMCTQPPHLTRLAFEVLTV